MEELHARRWIQFGRVVSSPSRMKRRRSTGLRFGLRLDPRLGGNTERSHFPSVVIEWVSASLRTFGSTFDPQTLVEFITLGCDSDPVA